MNFQEVFVGFDSLGTGHCYLREKYELSVLSVLSDHSCAAQRAWGALDGDGIPTGGLLALFRLPLTTGQMVFMK